MNKSITERSPSAPRSTSTTHAPLAPSSTYTPSAPSAPAKKASLKRSASCFCKPKDMNIILDTETSGLPTGIGYGRFPSYRKLSDYDTARIVSIAWIVSRGDQVVQQAYYVVKPDGFLISPESQAIHGISQEDAERDGIPITEVFAELIPLLESCASIVAHNVAFDSNVIMSELFRYNYENTLEILKNKNFICTMKKGKEIMNYYKKPRLEELYQFLYNEPISNAHNAQFDTYYCYLCFIKMFPAEPGVFFFKETPINLTDEQKAVVFEELDKNIMVIACAGSGKTTTTLCRIKHLLDNGVQANDILLTTYTRDSAEDMKDKLVDILGYKPTITAGTIHGIAKQYVTRRYGKASDLKHVDEYGHDFLKLIREEPIHISHYKYMFVDEFQDIDDHQFEIIQEFAKNGTLIFGVGDDAQNIFTFRGSNIEYILNFSKYFTPSTGHKLTYNFRSSKPIVEFANASIENGTSQIPKQMVAANPKYANITQKPRIQYYAHQGIQNNSIVKQITQLIQNNTPLHEIVVLSPINQPLYQIEELLTKHNIANIYLDGKGDVRTCRKAHHVCLSTIHKSKGLEWDYVFMVTMSDDVIPKVKNPKAIEEDRRLFYVAATRARRELVISYVPGMISKYITRYVNEVPASFYDFLETQPWMFGHSDMDQVIIKTSVTKLVELLDGKDFIKLKEQGIIPTVEDKDIKKTKLFEASSYKGIVKTEDLYTDFGIFVDGYITREMSRCKGLSESQVDKYAQQTLACVILEKPTYEVYRTYRYNFEENIAKLEPYKRQSTQELYTNAATIKSTLERNCKPISSAVMSQIMKILQAIFNNSIQFNMDLDKIPVFIERFLPQDFTEGMEKSLKATSDFSKPTQEIINDLWDVSKCQMIVNDRRRRLLFKKVTGTDILKENQGMFDNLSNFVESISAKYQQVWCRKDMRIEEGIFGELDMLVRPDASSPATVIEYKTAQSDDIDAKWLIQLLCYKVLCDYNKIPVHTMGVFNALRGWYYEIDVSSWNKHFELITYLLQKREEVLRRSIGA